MLINSANNLINKIIKHTKKYSLENFANAHYKEHYININTLRDTWLSWHNEVRNNL
jgi:hypothetical protein